MPGAPVSVPARATEVATIGTNVASIAARTPLPLIAWTSSEPPVVPAAHRGLPPGLSADRHPSLQCNLSRRDGGATGEGGSNGPQRRGLEHVLDLAGERDHEPRSP